MRLSTRLHHCYASAEDCYRVFQSENYIREYNPSPDNLLKRLYRDRLYGSCFPAILPPKIRHTHRLPVTFLRFCVPRKVILNSYSQRR